MQELSDGQGGTRTKLWWTIHDFTTDSTATTCVYAWDVTAGADAEVPCVVEDDDIFTLVAAGPQVFYSTDVAGGGFIHRVVEDGDGYASVDINLSLRHPLEVDEALLYAYSGAAGHEVVAARPISPTSRDLEDVGRVLLDEGEIPVHLEASHPDYLFFTTRTDEADPADQRWRLYRWRKPVAPVE